MISAGSSGSGDRGTLSDLGINSHRGRLIHSRTNEFSTFSERRVCVSPVCSTGDSDQAGNARPAFFMRLLTPGSTPVVVGRMTSETLLVSAQGHHLVELGDAADNDCKLTSLLRLTSSAL